MSSFQVFTPSSRLQPYVRYYWRLCDVSAGVGHERSVPWGCVQLFFHRGQRLFSPTQGRLQPRHFVCGQATRYSDLRIEGAIDMLVVVFQPHAARLFLGAPVSLFREASVAIDDVEDAALAELARRVEDTADPRLCIALIEQFLLSRLVTAADHRMKQLSTVVNLIDRCPQLDVPALADTACLSSKQLTRVFADYVGASPKDFLRIVRVQRALSLFQRQPASSFAQVAYACGFADQSHMIKEFRQFTGYTPAQYLAACAPVSDYFSQP